jgi:hypothetical protein
VLTRHEVAGRNLTTACTRPRTRTLSCRINGAARRVMPALDCWGDLKNSADGMRGRGGWRRREGEAVPAVAGGLTAEQAGGGRHGAARVPSSRARAAWRALKVTQSNKRMHATADTPAVISSRGLGRRVMPGVMLLCAVKGILCSNVTV